MSRCLLILNEELNGDFRSPSTFQGTMFEKPDFCTDYDRYAVVHHYFADNTSYDFSPRQLLQTTGAVPTSLCRLKRKNRTIAALLPIAQALDAATVVACALRCVDLSQQLSHIDKT
jgi:hypothetical protein